MENIKPLAGIKVVELSLMVVGAACARMMADWGADVIKVEDTGKGDNYRLWPAAVGAPIQDDCNPLFDALNANKKGISLNLKVEEGKQIMHRLLSGADVFVSNLRIEGLKRLGFDYDTLKVKYPKLVVAQVFGYGEKGPDKDKPGYDNVAFWARSGFLYSQAVFAGDNCYPVYGPMGVGDSICALAVMAGISSALLAAQRTGKGDRVAVSLYGTAMWLANIQIIGTQFGYKYPKSRNSTIPFGAPYLCADKRWFMPQVVDFNRDAPTFYKLIGAGDMADNPDYMHRPNFINPEFCAPVIERFEKIFSTKTSGEWEALFNSADLCCEILSTYEETLEDEQALANNHVHTMKYKNGTEVKLVRPPICSENLGLPDYNPGPMLGENTVEILKGLGYSPEEIQKFLADKVARQHD